MVKPLTFKGDKKPKKRKRTADAGGDASSSSARGAAAADDASTAAAAAAAAAVDDPAHDDSWVSADAVADVAGPVLFVLPSAPPSALACDASGRVFALPVENIVEGNPSSAEPHDVRQVWVANRVAGTEHFRFKGHHGKYLSCDKYGLLSATSEAVSPLESFDLVESSEARGAFEVKTLRGTYLAVQAPSSSKAGAAPEIRGDATESSLDTVFRIRMQARFKPRLQASKEEKAREKISRRQLEEAVGRRLEEDEVRRLKKARREGDYHEQLLDLKVKNKHDKYG